MKLKQQRRAWHYVKGAPAGILAVYDNGGKTLDRFTVAVSDKIAPQDNRLDACLCLSETGAGFSQWGHCARGSHLGRLRHWRGLPKELRRHIQARIS